MGTKNGKECKKGKVHNKGVGKEQIAKFIEKRLEV